jgi:hypothetical protein
MVSVDHDLYDLPPRISQIADQSFNNFEFFLCEFCLILGEVKLELLPDCGGVLLAVKDEFFPLLLVEEDLADGVGLLLFELAAGDEEGEGLVDKAEGEVEDLHEVAAHDFVLFGLVQLDVPGGSQGSFQNGQLSFGNFLHAFVPVLDDADIFPGVQLLQRLLLLNLGQPQFILIHGLSSDDPVQFVL